MDALLSRKGEWRVANADLREVLNQQLRDSVLVPYTAFFNENCRIQFSKKHTQQYLRYPPSEVDRLLINFF